jgi:hypothetical protein
MLETLQRISTMPDALGSHACECGHPEMRHLPNGTYHCPACGSEVLAIDVFLSPAESEEGSLAYWADGRFGGQGSFADKLNLERWESPSDRLDYCRGHRAGSEARQARNEWATYADEKSFG